MQNKEAKRLRIAYAGKSCDHPSIVKEYYLGAQTGDYVCTTCGKELSREEKIKIEQARN